jgi:hypothetical protein
MIPRFEVAIGASEIEWTVFFLEEVGAIDTITPVIQQGRYVTIGDVQRAMTSHSLAVPTLNTAFPLSEEA